MTAHTPGPWTVEHAWNGVSTIKGAHGKPILAVSKYHVAGDGINHVEANARLIAAAPDLLRGCEAALAYLADPASRFTNNRQAATDIIRAALAKAGAA